MECEVTPTEHGQQRVIRRFYKVQYGPDRQQSTGSQRSSSGSQRGSSRERDSQRGNLQRGKSMKAFDQDTDSDIFALGSAFKDGDFNIDEFLKSWTNTAGFKVAKVMRTTRDGEEDTTELPTGFMPQSVHKASQVGLPAISELSAGTSVFPFARRQQIITSVLPATGDTKPMVTTANDDSSEETYDNLRGQLQPLLPQDGQPGYHGNLLPGHHGNLPEQLGSYGNDDLQSSKTSSPSSQFEPEKKHLLRKSIEKPKDQAGEAEKEACPNEPKKVDFCIDIGDSDTVSSSAEEAEVRKPKSSAVCPMFSSPKRGKLRFLRGKARGFDTCTKGRTGMTASEFPLLGEERKLPAVQQMVMNYNRMLDTNREQFVETLFRAVKLNGVEVVKILCQLVLRKNMTLSNEDMREPESSATILHVALLYDHAEIVEYLIDTRDCELLMATYTKDEYKNQTALHVAVANGNKMLVTKLLTALHRKDRKTLMNTVATGSYFQENHPDGQLCLTAAAWAGNFDMLITLARHGANLTLKNLDGNTLMHRIIESSALHPDKMNHELMVDKAFEAVGESAKHCKYKSRIEDQRVLEQSQKQISTFQRLLNARNNVGLTPLALAAQSGTALLQYIVNMEKIYKIPQTKLGSISWVTYEVTEITSFSKDSYNKFSVLHIMAHNSGRQAKHENMEKDSDASFLDTEPIKTLIAMKWSVYRWVYITWCLLHLCVHMAFTHQTFDKNTYLFSGFSDEYDDDLEPRGYTELYQDDVNPWFGFFIILPIVYILLELVDLFGNYPYSIFFMSNMSLPQKVLKRITSEWVITGNGPYRCVMMTYSIMSIAWFVLYLHCSPYQNMALAMSLLLGWIFVLFFTRGCRVTSRFSIMIQKMFFRDLMYFMAVYVIILIGFSFAMNAMYTHLHQANVMLPRVIYRMMNIITEHDHKITLQASRHELFTTMLLIMYAIVAVILLMNMLIAMMNTSYETIRITRCNLWKQQQLSIMLMLERRLFWMKCLCRRSEGNIWQKEWEDGVKSYVDVTINYF